MSDELTTILRLVADGTLSAEEAAPIIDALTRAARPNTPPPPPPAATGRGRRVQIQVSERGKRVMDVRIPLAFAAAAARMVPGLPDRYVTLIDQAVASETIGTIVDAEDETGDGVTISVE